MNTFIDMEFLIFGGMFDQMLGPMNFSRDFSLADVTLTFSKLFLANLV